MWLPPFLVLGHIGTFGRHVWSEMTKILSVTPVSRRKVRWKLIQFSMFSLDPSHNTRDQSMTSAVCTRIFSPLLPSSVQLLSSRTSPVTSLSGANNMPHSVESSKESFPRWNTLAHPNSPLRFTVLGMDLTKPVVISRYILRLPCEAELFLLEIT